mgnify:CR=1 FL=1
MKAILFRDCKACFQSFKNWGMVLIIMVTAIFVEMVASGAGILDPFTWAVFFWTVFHLFVMLGDGLHPVSGFPRWTV